MSENAERLSMSMFASRADYEAHMDSLACAGCQQEAHPNWPLSEVHARCSQCDWSGSGGLLHTCKTGWRKPVCGGCNAVAGKGNCL
jgi:hypothetical protein